MNLALGEHGDGAVAAVEHVEQRHRAEALGRPELAEAGHGPEATLRHELAPDERGRLG